MAGTSNGRLAGKRAIVTGSAMGLGEAVARRFAAEGAQVAAMDLNREQNERMVGEIAAAGGSACALAGDVAVLDDCARVVAETVAQFGGIDILVNNAGVIPSRDTVIDTPEADWDQTLRVNAKGVFLMSKAALPHMIAQKSGNIVNMSSIAGLVGLPVRPAYCASKGAVAILTKQMAVDFGGHNIRVNAINPSFVITNINRAMFDQMQAEGAPWEQMLDRHPIRRLGQPEDVANAAVFLASDEAAWITGITLPVDGGYTAQ